MKIYDSLRKPPVAWAEKGSRGSSTGDVNGTFKLLRKNRFQEKFRREFYEPHRLLSFIVIISFNVELNEKTVTLVKL